MAKRTIIVALAAVFAVSLASLAPLARPAFAENAPDVIKLKRDIIISKNMTVNDAVVIYGSATVYGKVEGSLTVISGSVYLKGDARVKDIVVVGGEIIKEPGVSISGKVTQVSMPCFIPSLPTFLKGGWIALWAAVSALALLGFLGLAILIIALVPEHMKTIAAALERSFGAMLLWGMAGIMLIVPVAVLLAISIVGIILIPLEILLAALAFMVGYIIAAIYIGKNVFRSFKREPPPFVDALLGILILFVVGFVPVAGAVIKAVFLVAGFGSVLVTRFGTVK